MRIVELPTVGYFGFHISWRVERVLCIVASKVQRFTCVAYNIPNFVFSARPAQGLDCARSVGTYTMQHLFVKAGVGQSRTFCLCLQVRDDLGNFKVYDKNGEIKKDDRGKEMTLVPGGRWNLAAQHSIQEVVKRWADQYDGGVKIKFFFEEE